MPTPHRTILHLDMDAFFAAVEQRDHPHLRGKPVLVGYDGPRGVAAASYESRIFGCRSAQPIAVAKRLCPHAIVVPVRHELYREVSHHVFTILENFSPAIEPLSIDEAFLDLTGTERLLGTPRVAAAQMKQRIHKETHLTASVGISFNKFLAKLASDLQKPDGLVEITPENVDTLLSPMPVTRIWGVGPAMEARLELLGIITIGHLRLFPLETLREHLGEEADHYMHLALGQDDRPVVTDHQAKSIGHEQTFGTDLGSPAEVRRILIEQVDQVARRLRKHQLQARTITLKIRYGDFQTVTRSKSLKKPTSTTSELESLALEIWETWVAKSFQPVRLIGASASQLTEGEKQMDLFADPAKEKQKRMDKATDEIRRRFGEGSIKRGGALEHEA